MQKPTIQLLHKNYYHFESPSIMLVTQQFDKTIKEWKFVNYRCKYCDNSFKSLTTASKHPGVCKELNTTKRRKNTEMPIQTIMVKGEKMYRYGDSGKAYKTREEAEKQMRAMYASGYKEPKKTMEKK